MAELILVAGRFLARVARTPLPFLVGLAVSSNIGSMVTPVGNPQNILIATSSGLGFGDFAGALAIPAAVSLALAALAGAAVLLFTRRVKPDKVLGQIDGTLLLFFTALFVITKAVEMTAGFQALVSWSRR